LRFRDGGKVHLPGGYTLRSKLSEDRVANLEWSHCYFEYDTGLELVFGEALAFYEVVKTKQLFVVYHPFTNCQLVLDQYQGTISNGVKTLQMTSQFTLIGIWKFKETVHICHENDVAPTFFFISHDTFLYFHTSSP
jgi:hypothetical protein